MIITNFINKINRLIIKERETIIYVFIIILVGLISFFLGKLSVLKDKIPEYREDNGFYSIVDINNDISSEVIDNKAKKYVASKNGKLYYSISCALSSRIKEENKIWFASKEDAEKYGLSLSSSCKE